MFVYKHTETIEYVIRKIQTLRVNNSSIISFKKPKFLGYCFYMKSSISVCNFQYMKSPVELNSLFYQNSFVVSPGCYIS